jgi:riboflavin kinase/FMN adenylyltransferase
MDYLELTQVSQAPSCLALGRFDGLHRGHQAVIDFLTGKASSRGLRSTLLSFNYDNALNSSKCITSELEKRLLLEKSELDLMVSIDPESFDDAALVRFAVERLGAEVIVAGACDKRLPLFREMSSLLGFELLLCDIVSHDGEPVTRERAAELLDACEFKNLRAMLGHPYIIYGNLYRSMANIGRRPSVDDFEYVTVENFLLDFSGNLYGHYLRMDLQEKVRGVVRFDSLEEVREQVEKDLDFVRRTLEESFFEYTSRINAPEKTKD